jgi:hypothetical protein
MLKRVNTLVFVVMLLNGSLAIAQTNASKTSAVGTWNMDLEQSKSTFGSEPPPKSVTLTIIKDTPEAMAWRVDVVDSAGNVFSQSWEGPVDGTLHPVKGADGQVIAKQGLKRDGDALLRHGELPDGLVFDSRATMSADGNTVTDVGTAKSKDGKTSKATSVYRRVTKADRGRK